MQTPNQFDSPYDGPTIEGDDINYHVVVTTHPYMAEIGLSAFTTGQLYEWMQKTNSKGEYVNLKIFGENRKKTNPQDEKEVLDFNIYRDIAERIFGLEKPALEDKSFTRFNFDAWRFYDDGGGEYIKYYDTLLKRTNWKYKKYTWSNLKIDDFNQKRVLIPNFDSPIVDENGNVPIDLEDQKNLDNYVSNLIEMNNYVRYRTMGTPKSKWQDIDKVRSEFVLDVKSSFQKCVEWSGIVPFTLNLGFATSGDGSVASGCVKEEMVGFKLFLFDDNLPKENARKVTMSELVYVAPKIDSFGRAGNKQNGDLTPVSREIQPKNSTAGSLDLQWNEFEGKWQSGTPQVIAILTTNIAAAKLPTLEQITNETVSSLIGRNMIIPVGSAIPLNMQNGNPYQLGPDFKLTKDCRNGNTDKFQVRVYNRVPRPWPSGEIVILNKIDGVWQPSAYGEPKEEVLDIAGFDGNWDFMYLMAHADTYFSNKQKSFVTYQQFEEGIRALYYGPYSLTNINGSQNYQNAIKYAEVNNDYFQVTSWDFMGPKIGGLRPKGNALACTRYDINPSGTELNTPYVDANTSNPFFGCVFPDGYELGLKWGEYQESTHDTLIPYTNFDLIEAMPQAFIKQVNSEVAVFDNDNVNTASGAAGGMFILGNRNVSHLPADIALNASPSGVNGSPIKPIWPFKHFSSLHSTTENCRTNLDKWFFDADQKRKGVWMNLSVNPDQLIPKDKYDSAFDFAPVNPGKLTFRPLKLETYSSFEFSEDTAWETPPDQNGSYPQYIKWWYSPYPGVTVFNNASMRGLFGHKDWSIMSDKKSPISMLAFERNLFNNQPVFSPYQNLVTTTVPTKFNDIYGYKGLRYNIDLQGLVNSSKLPQGDTMFPKPLWSKGWTHGQNSSVGGLTPGGSGTRFIEWIEARGSNLRDWHDIGNNRPAGAVGIIGAQCTVTAKDSISIECASYLGVSHYFTGSIYKPSVRNEAAINYASLNASTLNMRIFHAWPKNLTVYDPRFFSVFHFNPGVGILDDNDQNKKYDWYNAGELTNSGEGGVDLNDVNYPDGWYQVERSESEVDLRIPTSSEVDAVGISQSLPIQSIINSDTARKKEHCNLIRKRRGQLLPYAYSALDIGLAAFTNTYIQAYNGPQQEKFAKDTDFVILCPGSGYSNQDRFFVAGGNGQGTILKPVLGSPGFGGNTAVNGIVQFEVISAGFGYSSEDFLEAYTLIKCELPAGADKAIIYDQFENSIEPTIKIIPSGKPKGTGFDGYIVRGKVIGINKLDAKPLEIVSNKKLTQNLKVPLESDTLVEMPQGLEQTVVTLTAKNSDETFGLKNKYDIFFHFHNDISHTYSYWGQSPDSYGSLIPRPYEQHATITISPV